MADLFYGQSKWRHLVEWLGGDSGEAMAVFDNVIVPAYAEKHRHYHTLKHILACLDVLDQKSPTISDRDSVELAIWFHDIVYDPYAKDNEEKSRDLLLEKARFIGLPDSITQSAAEMILLTKHATAPDSSSAAAYMIDADLSILGTDEGTFDQYEREVRLEYAKVSDDLFRSARATILRSFMDRPTIFSTTTFKTAYEEKARQNIARSLRQLG